MSTPAALGSSRSDWRLPQAKREYGWPGVQVWQTYLFFGWWVVVFGVVV